MATNEIRKTKQKTKSTTARKSQGHGSVIQYKTESEFDKKLNTVYNPYLQSTFDTFNIYSKDILTIDHIDPDIKNKQSLTFNILNTEIKEFIDKKESKLTVLNEDNICQTLYIEFQNYLFNKYKVINCSAEFVKSIPKKFKDKCINKINEIERTQESIIQAISSGSDKYLTKDDYNSFFVFPWKRNIKLTSEEIEFMKSIRNLGT